MGLFDSLKKKKAKPEDVPAQTAPQKEPPKAPADAPSEKPQFYEESGGVTKEKAIELIQGLCLPPDRSPMGVAGGEHDYGIISCPAYVVIFFHQDKDHPMKIEKRAFMPLKGIMDDARYYCSQGDFGAVADCLLEGVERNQWADEHWELYAMAGEVLWKLREISTANNLFLKAYQCKDCDQKAHVLCQAAATRCIMRDPNAGFALYHKALEEEPDSLEVLHDLGGFHWDMGELDKAAEYYFSVLKKDPSYYASYEELSNLFKQLGDAAWPGPFMDCFTKKRTLPTEKLTAAEKDMQTLLAKQKT